MDFRLSNAFVIFLALTMFSCYKTNTVKIKNEAGRVLEQYEINRDSMKHGKYFGFFENGDTFEVSNYDKGRLNGVRKIYTIGNVLQVKEYYVNDSLQGPYQVYYPNGQVKLILKFTDNVIVGQALGYYESGMLREEVTMSNNLENGPFVEFYENGQKSWEGNYENGENEIGLLVHFAENGDTIKKMMCDERYICRTFYQNPEYAEKE